ncbi:MAG: 2,3,4,5-tetrahydropyridine-2,6-dicarboxylate N-succinyltransferase [Bdellovibrionales bacterium]
MSLADKINELYETPEKVNEGDNRTYVLNAIDQLDRGELRVCEKHGGNWIVNDWAKKAVLLYFRAMNMKVVQAGDLKFFDKIPLKQWTGEEGVRVVPHALVRTGAYVEKGAVLMPSYVNIGAYVATGTMVDTWATVGSCAQIGKNVHLSGGVGIGGVLEPIQATPVIVEDNCFIGSRCIVVEGAVIEEGAVLGAGVTITASTKIIDVTGSEEKTYIGRVPKNSVVIPGTRVKNFPAGDFGVPCALIIGERKESTDKKTSLTDALRDFNVSV